MAQPTIGLIVPPREPFMHPDTRGFPQARFVAEGLGIDEMAAEDFDAAIDRVEQAAAALRRRGARSIALLGTSLSFFRRPQFNFRLQQMMHEAGGCPAVTASTAVVGALRAHRATRIAVGTAYDHAMNARLEEYLVACGFDVASLVGMGIRRVREAMAVADEAIVELFQKAWAPAADADAVLISCGAFATGHLLPELEKRCGRPVVSTTPATLAAAINAIAP
jgi:arylmalonate decarboxylase